MRWTPFSFLILLYKLTLMTPLFMWRLRLLTWLTIHIFWRYRGVRRCLAGFTTLILLTLTSVFVSIGCRQIFSWACLIYMLNMLLLFDFPFNLIFVPHFTLSWLCRTLLCIQLCLVNTIVVLKIDLFRINCVLNKICLLWTYNEAGCFDCLFRMISTTWVNLSMGLITVTTVWYRTLGSLFLVCIKWLHLINNFMFNWTWIKISIFNQNLITTCLIMKLYLFTA